MQYLTSKGLHLTTKGLDLKHRILLYCFERTYTFHVVLNALPTTATLIKHAVCTMCIGNPGMWPGHSCQ